MTVRLAARASDEQIAAARGVAGVVAAGAVDGVLRVGADDPETVAPGVIRALVANGADVVEVRPESPSLERIYFEIMGVTPGTDGIEDVV